MKSHFGIILSSYATSIGRSQASIAEEAGITPASLNRFFNGRTNLYSDALVAVLKAMDIDLVQLVLDKHSKKSKSDHKVETTLDAVAFLYKNLEPLGQQTQLKQLEWINTVAGKQKIPKAVSDIIKKEINLI